MRSNNEKEESLVISIRVQRRNDLEVVTSNIIGPRTRDTQHSQQPQSSTAATNTTRTQ